MLSLAAHTLVQGVPVRRAEGKRNKGARSSTAPVAGKIGSYIELRSGTARSLTPPPTAKNLSNTIARAAILYVMNPLASFAFLMTTAQSLAAAVTTRDNLHLRPQTARKAVAARLASGLRVLRAFVRRMIILMALELEWGLVDKRGDMKRPHKRKSKPMLTVSLTAFDAQGPSPWLGGDGPQFKPVIKYDHTQGHGAPVDIDMTKLYAQLDFLAKIAANPASKAKRLAFHLARGHEGIIMAPRGPARIAGRWGTQVSASFDAMAGSIITKSRNRPPPLKPLRTHWPTITAL